MTRVVVSKKELARALSISELDVDRWVEDGCPCSRIRQGLVLFEEGEVRAWSGRRQFEAIRPLLARIHDARTPEDVASVARELPDLVARGLISRAGARDVRHQLARLARKLADERRRP